MYHAPVSSRNLTNAVTRRLFDTYFVGYGLAWVVIHLCRLWAHPLPYVNGWLTDFCFVPVICHVALTLTRSVITNNETYCYPFSFVMFVAIYSTVLFEMIVPGYSGNGTGDAYDGVAYFGGALFFYFVHQKKVARSVRPITVEKAFGQPAFRRPFKALLHSTPPQKQNNSLSASLYRKESMTQAAGSRNEVVME